MHNTKNKGKYENMKNTPQILNSNKSKNTNFRFTSMWEMSKT